MDVCALCGALRHSLPAEVESRVSALLQTCDRSKTTLRQLLHRLKEEGGSVEKGIRISTAQLQQELDVQLHRHRKPQASGNTVETPLYRAFHNAVVSINCYINPSQLSASFLG